MGRFCCAYRSRCGMRNTLNDRSAGHAPCVRPIERGKDEMREPVQSTQARWPSARSRLARVGHSGFEAQGSWRARIWRAGVWRSTRDSHSSRNASNSLKTFDRRPFHQERRGAPNRRDFAVAPASFHSGTANRMLAERTASVISVPVWVQVSIASSAGVDECDISYEP